MYEYILTIDLMTDYGKRQTRPPVREGAPSRQDCNFQHIINIWSLAPDGARHQDSPTDWPSVVTVTLTENPVVQHRSVLPAVWHGPESSVHIRLTTASKWCCPIPRNAERSCFTIANCSLTLRSDKNRYENSKQNWFYFLFYFIKWIKETFNLQIKLNVLLQSMFHWPKTSQELVRFFY
jgi:hypothetical protein